MAELTALIRITTQPKKLIKLVLMFCLLPSLATGQQKQDSKPKTAAPQEDRLRVRLRFNPHDAEAHKALTNILHDKYAFRAIVVEDAAWLSNNRTDSFALTELISFSEAALHDPEFAIEQLKAQIAAVPREQDPEEYNNNVDQLAAKLLKRGRPEEALPLSSELVRLHPTDAGLWGGYGDCLSASGKPDEAAKAFRRAIELNPSMEVFHEGFAEALLKAGDLEGAESEYRAALSIYDAQYKKGEPTDSYHSFINKMVKLEAASGEEHALAERRMKLAHVLLLDKKYDEALIQARGALEVDHHQFSSYYLQALILDASGNRLEASKIRDTAASIIQKQAESEPGWKKNQSQMEDARILFLSDTLWNTDSEYPAFPSEILSILEPRSASLTAYERLMLADAYFALERVQDGKKQWETAISSDKNLDNPVTNFNLGEQLLKAGAFADALPHFRRAYELDPQNSTIRYDYELVRQRLQH